VRGDRSRMARDAAALSPDGVVTYVWEQGFIASRFAGRPSVGLPTQRYFYPLFDGLPGGMTAYDYANNPSGFASIHFGGPIDKPTDAIALALAPEILGRVHATVGVGVNGHAAIRAQTGERAIRDAYFGTMFDLMRGSLVAGGSELGLGMTLFSLAVSIRVAYVVEIGRFKGFSTLCLASALRFLDIGWEEPAQHKQRPDVDYDAVERRQRRKLLSIDPNPTADAVSLLRQAGLEDWVEMVDSRSDSVTPPRQADLLFIDGDHTYEGCRADVERYLKYLRPGGYFVLHDYFGWYDEGGRNHSPIKRVVDELVRRGRHERLLIDTGYMSMVVLRKRNPATDGPSRSAGRARRKG